MALSWSLYNMEVNTVEWREGGTFHRGVDEQQQPPPYAVQALRTHLECPMEVKTIRGLLWWLCLIQLRIVGYLYAY